jgi:ABC-type multidrug transport system ATPase subunit
MPVQNLLNPSAPVIAEFKGLRIAAGLNAVTGDEGSGKTRLLRELSELHSETIWFDLKLPECNLQTPLEVWAHWRNRCPRWHETLCLDLCEALDMTPHLEKRLDMLSTGGRRKVALIALLASGARITCLDQPFAALDQVSIRVLCEFLNDMADHTSRAWLIGDYEADARLQWTNLISLDQA